jgi:hypothetical protein
MSSASTITAPAIDAKLHPNYSKLGKYPSLSLGGNLSEMKRRTISYRGQVSEFMGYRINFYDAHAPHHTEIIVEKDGVVKAYGAKCGIIALCISLSNKGHKIDDVMLFGMMEKANALNENMSTALELKAALGYFNSKTKLNYNLIIVNHHNNEHKITQDFGEHKLKINPENHLLNSIVIECMSNHYRVGLFEIKDKKLIKIIKVAEQPKSNEQKSPITQQNPPRKISQINSIKDKISMFQSFSTSSTDKKEDLVKNDAKIATNLQNKFNNMAKISAEDRKLALRIKRDDEEEKLRIQAITLQLKIEEQINLAKNNKKSQVDEDFDLAIRLTFGGNSYL